MNPEPGAMSAVRGRKGVLLGSTLLGLVVFGSVAWAQDEACTLVDSTSGPPRQILKCPSGPVVEAETKANVRVIEKDGHPSGASVDKGAALIEIPAGYPGGFQITTPRAVATVRGTMWVMDVEAGQTSVFVLRGEVLVNRPGSDQSVVLDKGDGVDVADDGKPLNVIRWQSDRVTTLLARFGR